MSPLAPANTQSPLPPAVQNGVKKPITPWMQLGELDLDRTLTPPPAPFLADTTAQQRAAMRFAVRGNAVFTGGAGVLALASARGLLEHGVSGIALLDLPAALERGKAGIEALRADFPAAEILDEPCDVTDAEGMQNVVQSVAERLGELNILCCFAGIVCLVHAEEMSINQWKRVIDVNTTGTWIAAQAVGKHMIASGRGGKIVFISSISGHRVNYPQPQMAYNTSKAALFQMRSSLAAEWTRYGIHVNTVSPGYMDTVLNEGEVMAPLRKIWADQNPMRRMGSPQELTGAVVLLCSNIGGSYINGTDIVVDGGGMVF